MQRAVDDPLDLVRPDVVEPAKIRHQLGVDDDAAGCLGATATADVGDEGADHILDTPVDVGAVERGDTGVEKRLHVGDRLLGANLAVIARQLPAALDDAGDAMTRAQVGGFDGHFVSPRQ